MQALGGVVTLLNCALSAVIGVRLIRLAARSKGPESWLGVYLLAGVVLGTLLSSAVYISWADPTVAMPPDWRPPLHALQFLANSAGMLGIAIFTQRVFRPQTAWARVAVLASIAIPVVAFAATAWIEGFEVRVIQNPLYCVAVASREAAMIWMTVESFLYYGQLRRRQRLGLADPMLVNRFLLWGIWAASMSLMQLSDPIGRLWYWSITGTTVEWLPEVGKTIIVFMIGSTSALGSVAAITLLLTFFPTAPYRRWVAAHAATSEIPVS